MRDTTFDFALQFNNTWNNLRRIDHSSRGVLPTVARRCVWSQNLENAEAKARYRAVKIQPQWVVTPGKQQTTLLGIKTAHLSSNFYTEKAH